MDSVEEKLKETADTENIYLKPAQDIGVGIVSYLEPPLTDTKKQLKELTLKQEELIGKLHNENLSISEVQYSQELQAMFTKMKLYHSKLQVVKKELRILHDRSQKLKKRATKLKELKEREPIEEVIITKPTNVIPLIGSTSSSSLNASESM